MFKALLGSTLTASLIIVVYFIVPMTLSLEFGGLLALLGGLALVAALLAWQIRNILVSPYPVLRGVASLVVTVPLFVVVFATIYYLSAQLQPDGWSEPLTRLDAVYYTVTVFATVGFGDITAVSQTARAMTTFQMVAGIALVGVIARVVVGAVQFSLRRRESAE